VIARIRARSFVFRQLFSTLYPVERMKTVEALHDLAAALSALADPVRMRVLRVLEAEELAVGEIAQIVQLPQSTISRRLKLLADHGWVQRRAAGTATLYRCVSDDLPPTLRGVWSELRESTAQSEDAEADIRRLRAVIASRRPGSAAFFGRVGAQWDDVSRELYGERYAGDALASLLRPGLIIADVGCGTGAFAGMLSPVAKKLVAIDREPTMLEAARTRLGEIPNVEFVLGEAERLPLEDQSVDLVVLGLVLHHLEHPERALREVSRVLLPGGRVLIVDMLPHQREELRLEMGHVWLGFTGEQLGEWCQQAGLHLAEQRALPSTPQARGPETFAATAHKLSSSQTE
jgi:ArsR family transcriptional regulator